MKGLFPPTLKGIGSDNNIESQLDADVSMDEHSHASAMTTESMTIGSPPRTQRKKRSSFGATRPAQETSVRSRLFPEPHDNNKDSTILKPFDLNQEFANSASDGNASPGSPPTRNRTSTLTPFRRRCDGQATLALRKRQAEQDDLYGRDFFCQADEDDAFSAAESPVDMYTSPRISPSKTKHRVAMHRSPFSSSNRQKQQPLQYAKSPSHFQTLDGRTVQSKNPFSPMVFDDTPTPTPSRPLPHSPVPGKNGALGLTHPLLLTTDSLSDSSGAKSHLVLRHKLQKRGSSPCNSNTNNTMNSAATNVARMNPLGMNGLGLPGNPNDDQEQKTSKYIRDGYPEPTGRYSFTGSPIKENFATTACQKNEPPKPSLPQKITQPVPPEQNGQSQDVCTNIHKVRRRSKGDDVVAAAAQGESSWKKDMFINTQPDDSNFLDFDKNNNTGMYNTIPNNSYFYNQQKMKDDNISPTDVFSFPQFRASPSDTSTLPPTPSKPVRRPPVRRYTPIRKNQGPPPTPAARKPRTFDDSSDDEGVHRRRRLRPLSDSNTTTVGALPPSRFYSDFDVIAELGSGSFGNVYKVLSRLDGCFYAIKVANRVAKGIADKDRMLKEVYALAALSDRADTATFHIVRYHQAWMEEERLYIQTELCTTTLQAEMQLAAPKQLPLATRFKCLREILLALNFIHNNQMVHLDIKPENIFLKNDQFKLGDFGLVSKVTSHDVEEGDSRYMSMELLSGKHDDLTKSDIFSLGIAMYELCLGSSKTLPSNGPEWQSLRSGRILPPPDTTDELFQIIKQMMNTDFRQRPSAGDLLERPELLSEDQKRMLRAQKLSQALASRPLPKPKGLVRRNTWSAF